MSRRIFTTIQSFVPTKVASQPSSFSTREIVLPSLTSRVQHLPPRQHHHRHHRHQQNQYVATTAKVIPSDGKTLSDFIPSGEPIENVSPVSHYADYSHSTIVEEEPKTFTIETYGCQMNVSDSEVVRAVLLGAGYEERRKGEGEEEEEVDLVLLNTCAIRDKAETKIWNRLKTLRNKNNKRKKQHETKLGVLGCMAERLKERLLEGEERAADFVVGPDAYRDLPQLLRHVLKSTNKRGGNIGVGARDGATEEEEEIYDPSMNMSVQLTADETYADIAPVRDNHSSVSAFTTIMRGCNNMCSFCIVPHVRGRERSRSSKTIIEEVQRLSDDGYKEVVLLGQNVNSYFDGNIVKRRKRKGTNDNKHQALRDKVAYVPTLGFENMYNLRDGTGVRFADLLASVAEVNPEMRVRFTSPHPKDFPDSVLDCIASYPNIAKGIHMPAQSGSNQILKSMRRNHTRDAYLNLIQRFREKIPNVEFSTDLITGFCGETEEDHQDTLSLLKEVEYEMAFMFAYSMRERTHAWHKVEKGEWKDDITVSILFLHH
jgi:tRNA A37 methylthiotransferase MiaB